MALVSSITVVQVSLIIPTCISELILNNSMKVQTCHEVLAICFVNCQLTGAFLETFGGQKFSFYTRTRAHTLFHFLLDIHGIFLKRGFAGQTSAACPSISVLAVLRKLISCRILSFVLNSLFKQSLSVPFVYISQLKRVLVKLRER